MELRHLDTLLAIDEEGSFTGAADALSTAQSNVSEQVRQLEAELGASLLVRSRRGALPTECGDVVLDRARRIRREIEAMRVDLAAVLGLEVGQASFGIVGTASRWVVPPVVAELRARAPGIRLRVQEAASERLVSEVADGDLAQAVVTEPVTHPRLRAEPLLEEALVAVVPAGAVLPEPPVPLGAVLELGLVLPPTENPLRHEVEAAAAQQGLSVPVVVEVEGIRLIADLVAAGAGASILPETALPPELHGVRTAAIAGMPPRRLALVVARDTRLSLADLAVRESVLGVVADQWAPSGLTMARR
ncbi:MAG: LysR family transcriptional regulator [Acidimicrobiia bacterium]|jgi:DNA-binding transcriptional LysR family regulator|nr:LysR family transcriptional regulator [Acidimicrobiia bacterium]